METRNNVEVRIQGIRIVGPVFDGSGYAQGIRNYIRGLFNAKVPFHILPISFEKDRPELTDIININGQEITEQDFLRSLCHQMEYDVNFVRLSPEIAVQFLDDKAINICACAWETTRLDPHWVDCCNRFDAIFVESQWLVQVFTDSGVKKPIYCVPNCVDVSKYTLKDKPNMDKTYQFYAIMQWTERKNGIGLLKSYFNAFTPKDDVVLILKTYLTRVEAGKDQKTQIVEHINSLKRSLNLLTGYPPVYLITEKLTNEALIKLHEDCDCYAMLDRGEGFGLPYMDACAAGNPIIAPNFGGTREFLNETNSYCVDGQLTYVDNMMWSNFYRGNQAWFEPNLLTASELMRHVYENREEAFQMGLNARQNVEENFNREVITNRLLGALAEVVGRKRGM